MLPELRLANQFVSRSELRVSGCYRIRSARRAKPRFAPRTRARPDAGLRATFVGTPIEHEYTPSLLGPQRMRGTRWRVGRVVYGDGLENR